MHAYLCLYSPLHLSPALLLLAFVDCWRHWSWLTRLLVGCVSLHAVVSRAGKSHFSVFVEAQRLTLLDLLNLFPSTTPPLAHLLSALPPMPPRLYSIASSPLSKPSSVAIAFTVVAYDCVASTPVRVVWSVVWHLGLQHCL